MTSTHRSTTHTRKDTALMRTTYERYERTFGLLAATAIAAWLLLLTSGGSLDALQAAAGGGGTSTRFAAVITYLTNLRNGFMGLVVAGGSLATIGVAGAFMVGNERAQKWAVGVLVGVGLAILSPDLIA